MSFNHHIIEKKWQDFWEENETYRVEKDANKEKYYVLDMFPYPSGQGLHVGHVEGYTATDIMARFKRAQGKNVLHPIGWDAFGLPAEQYALDTGHDPAEFTQQNINNFKRQIKSLGFSYDWSREINTTDPNYMKWTQWIFTKLYEKGLAYKDEVMVNWSEDLGTVLANEEVIDGKTERGGFPVVRKPLKQWVLKITAYADRLLNNLDDLDWPEQIKEMQRNWIGRSVGADVTFSVEGSDDTFQIFTTRLDTLYGATFCVLAPEHELVKKITTPEQREAVEAYIEQAAHKSDMERTELEKDKTGVFTGAYAINPINGNRIPIWIGDYVLSSYGFGAVMAVPAHDERDYAFAKKYDLDIIPVIEPADGAELPYTGEGKHINSGEIDGIESIEEAVEKLAAILEAQGKGKRSISYRLRDWIFSRQRYWGEPIPIIHWEDGTTTTVPEDELPLRLPEGTDIKPSGTGESPLANYPDWLEVVDPETGMKGRRETNTMPQWAGSSWYFLRYCDPTNDKELISKEAADYWTNVDLYIGGAEHAVLHLLYARFWNMVLYDLGLVPNEEPFQKLFNQGMILGEGNEKMSKSKGNVVNPDDVVEQYGADTLRLYEMFMGPLDASVPWDEDGLQGARKFLERVWRLYIDEKGEVRDRITTVNTGELDKPYNQTVKKVTDDFEILHFNTAISQMMVFVNAANKAESLSFEYAKGFIKLLAPIAPHISNEIWERLTGDAGIDFEPWPTYDESQLVEDQVEIVVQVNGKIKAHIAVATDTSKEALQEIATNDENVQQAIAGKEIVKIIPVPNKLVNIVVK